MSSFKIDKVSSEAIPIRKIRIPAYEEVYRELFKFHSGPNHPEALRITGSKAEILRLKGSLGRFQSKTSQEKYKFSIRMKLQEEGDHSVLYISKINKEGEQM